MTHGIVNGDVNWFREQVNNTSLTEAYTGKVILFL